jgi:hypothetical protein
MNWSYGSGRSLPLLRRRDDPARHPRATGAVSIILLAQQLMKLRRLNGVELLAPDAMRAGTDRSFRQGPYAASARRTNGNNRTRPAIAAPEQRPAITIPDLVHHARRVHSSVSDQATQPQSP